MASGGWGEGRYGVGVWGTGQIDVSVSLTGVVATGQLGNEFAKANSDIYVAPVVATASIEPVGVSGDADNILVAGTQAVVIIGEELASTTVDVVLTGVSSSVTLGQVNQSSGYYFAGVQALGQLGNETVEVEANVYPISATGVGHVGTPSVVGIANVTETGVEASGQVGNEIARAAATVFVVGVEGVTQLGETDEDAQADVEVLGVVSSVRVGQVFAAADAAVFVTGVRARGKLGKPPLVWSEINDDQTPDWQNINEEQSPDWILIPA